MRKRSKNWDAARKMPPLRHSVAGEAFDITHSEAAMWLVSQPKIMQQVFDHAAGCKDICYDPNTGTWKGADYDA